MQTNEIPQQQWVRFFDDFSRQHAGWVVTLEVIGREIGDQNEVNNLPLVGLSADIKGTEPRIEIIAGRRTTSHVTRIINRPKRVWVKEPGETIEIESEDETKTLLSFEQVQPGESERQLTGQTGKGRG
ncbi:MAG: DUF5335 family protein [Acidobacteriota bacterium]